MARAAKKVESKDAEETFTGAAGLSTSRAWYAAPETRAEFIERIASSVVCNAQGWDTLKNGKVVATVAFNMATELANLLEKRDKGD